MSNQFFRTRRLRKNPLTRDLIAETSLSLTKLIYPMFVCPGTNIKRPIESMPGQYQWSIDTLVEEARSIRELGIPAILLFGIPHSKDLLGREAYDDKGIIPQAVRALKSEVNGLLVITDVCLCEYTSHGHCGIYKDGDVDNDATLELLSKEALCHAQAGADIIAPSDMMDGRVLRIRETLDRNGFTYTPLMAYSAKFASGFYGPFREAAESKPQQGNRSSYQMDIRNKREAIRELIYDEEEGADILMVKPALSFLDIISLAREATDLPVAAYSVSGEYSMIKAAAMKKWIDEKRIVMETHYSIFRAGADMLITYWAKDIALWLGEDLTIF
jgi:porphobilinogen synthase